MLPSAMGGVKRATMEVVEPNATRFRADFIEFEPPLEPSTRGAPQLNTLPRSFI